MENWVEYDDSNDLDEGALVETRIRRMRNRRARLERRGRNLFGDEMDGSMGNIKMIRKLT